MPLNGVEEMELPIHNRRRASILPERALGVVYRGASTMKKLTVVLAALAAGSLSFAQQSASYRLAEQAFNAGGNPSQGTVLTSTSYRIRLDAIGDAVGGGALTAPSFHIGGGFIAPYPPPGEVRNVRFSAPTSMVWDHEVSVGAYNIYRGTVGSFAGYGACFQSDLPTEVATIPGSPSTGQAFYFLVTAENTINDEGTKGFASSGAMRPNASPCP